MDASTTAVLRGMLFGITQIRGVSPDDRDNLFSHIEMAAPHDGAQLVKLVVQDLEIEPRVPPTN